MGKTVTSLRWCDGGMISTVGVLGFDRLSTNRLDIQQKQKGGRWRVSNRPLTSSFHSPLTVCPELVEGQLPCPFSMKPEALQFRHGLLHLHAALR